MPLILGWAGMRGVVSLASALAIPIYISSGQHFRHRNLILFITFVVILVTLVVQGLSLPWLIRLVKLEGNSSEIPESVQIEAIRYRLVKEEMELLKSKYAQELEDSNTVKAINLSLKRSLEARATNLDSESKIKIANERELYKKVMQDLIDVRRNMIYTIRGEKSYDESILRNLEHNLDLEESRLNRK
ncbi:hypothetical protein [Sphingobacterium daejeonense]|uniref:hypothetical protein n=1 Tax=Sphingobacterium daejeonense TaxID=371142 RepID=UPI0010C255C6|nr:hypothetical protein [Sphingobacterium daejeonense]VTQ02831.1 Sodium, potassium, lithium and rubidium/H(+) antiporter [Sphingobacterium daejeonense]